MYALILASMIIGASPQTPTEITGSAATPAGTRSSLTVEQQPNAPDPFGYIAPEQYETLLDEEQQEAAKTAAEQQNNPPPQKTTLPAPLVSQTSTVNPKNMNPLDYQNKIENTIYQQGDRLIFIQAVPIKYIKQATTPNLQPAITDYPAL